LIDGGVFANNPAMCACVEAFKMNPTIRINELQVLSIGTGAILDSYHYSEANSAMDFALEKNGCFTAGRYDNVTVPKQFDSFAELVLSI